ncbi:MAG: hypothetical protein K9W43_11060 [Candidatus Thorarchaeota archaeon]|nr:hypothetical protein [Candidatus Thorarchaeota archaeon]
MTGENDNLIVSAALIDLHGPKILAQESFYQSAPSVELHNRVLEQFYELAVAVSMDEVLELNVADRHWLVTRLDDVSVIVVQCHDSTPDTQDITALRALKKAFMWKMGDGSIREYKAEFVKLVRRHLVRPAKFVIITSAHIGVENHSGKATLSMVSEPGGTTREPIRVGPYLVSVKHCDFETFQWTDDFLDATGFGLVVSPDVDEGFYHKTTETIRSHLPSALVLVIPGSDDELEFARQIEDTLDAQLCDSVSEDSINLLLTLLATAMLTDMHPELARKTWAIEKINYESPISEIEHLGHQAFIVTEKQTGTAVFTYYYEPKSKVIERAPNLITAISMFKLDYSGSNKTSVFTTGTLNFIMIEHDELVFTLITGNRDDVDELREKFSFLPDLWKDENPDDLQCVEDDLYKSPPFTLKLLATLPPEYLLPRMVPYRVKEIEWDRFSSEMVKDFLQAVWSSLDGHMDLKRLAYGGGPQMTLGAIHLLRRLGAIDLKVVIRPTDILEKGRPPTSEERSLYSNLDKLLGVVDGTRTLSEIAQQAGIDNNVLITVFTELYKRGIIRIRN